MGKREIKTRLRVALAEADPIGTDLSFEERLDEYTLEAGEIAKGIRKGQPLDNTVATVFKDTCGLDLTHEKVSEIVAGYEKRPAGSSG